MPYKSEKIPINNELLDKRVKLTRKQKEEIRQLARNHAARAKKGIRGEAISQRILAKRFHVSRRTIQFILDPAKLKRNKEAREARGGWKHYYYNGIRGKKYNDYMRKHRQYKYKLLQEGKIGKEVSNE